MSSIKVLIIDDERLAREELKRHLLNHTDCELVGEAADADEAAKLIEALRPELLLLDIKMPGRSGFELLESLEWTPAVIFTTAYDDYAVKAFEINALDYLVKPIRDERFAMAINRVKEQVIKRQGEQDTKEVAQNFFVKEGDRYYFIKPDEISLIESAGNYARIYFNDKKVLIKKSLNQLEKTLDAAVFFRVNRQEIINTRFISQMQALHNGQLTFTLKTDTTVTVSNRQSALFKNKHGSL